jgi:hypothetical protein
VTEPHAADCCLLDERRRPEAPVSESTRHQCGAAPRAAAPQPKSGCCRR